MKGKIPSGKHLEETWILLPDAVMAAGGFTPPAPAPVPGGTPPISAPTSGTLFPTTPAGPPPGGQTSGGAAIDPDAIFGGTPVAQLVHHQAPATSALNLLGRAENWGIDPATKVQNVSLKITELSGAQLHNLLKNLPDGISYELEVDKESA
jgi:hypothetical protein